MMKESAIQSMNLMMIEDGGRTLTLNNTLLVTDTIGTTNGVDMDARVEKFINRFPMKLTSSCMVIVSKGMLKFSVNFRDFVVSESTCLFISEGTIVENLVYEKGSNVIFLTFSQSKLLPPTAASQRNINNLYALQVVLVKLLQPHLEMLKSVYQMLRTVLSDSAFAINQEATAFSCLSLMQNIILQATEGEKQLSTKVSRRDEIVTRFLQCVADNYRTHRELSFYAKELNLSLKYMSQVVHGQTGRHPSQWIKDYVILDAKSMLRSGRYTVQQVAEELNFPNQSFFGKYFKEAVGVSPKKWK